MDEAEIVRFTSSDLALGKRLTDREGWFRSAEDWGRLLRLEPEGAFKARAAGTDAGIACTIAYDRVAWIHSMIVDEAFRGRGIGGELLRACIRFAMERGIPCVKLDSVLGVEGFYERFGFRTEFSSLRFHRDGEPFPRRAVPIRRTDLQEVAAFDRAATGLDRGRVLEALYADRPDRAFLVRRGEAVRGFLLGRPGNPRGVIGPCVADPEDPGPARDLVTTYLGAFPEERFRMCVPARSGLAVELLEDLGFERVRPSTRMYRGHGFEETAANVAATGAEKG